MEYVRSRLALTGTDILETKAKLEVSLQSSDSDILSSFAVKLKVSQPESTKCYMTKSILSCAAFTMVILQRRSRHSHHSEQIEPILIRSSSQRDHQNHPLGENP